MIDASDISCELMRPTITVHCTQKKPCLPPRSPLRTLQTKIDTVNQGAARMIVAASNAAMPGNGSDKSPMGLAVVTSFTIRGTDQLCQPSVTVEDRQAV